MRSASLAASSTGRTQFCLNGQSFRLTNALRQLQHNCQHLITEHGYEAWEIWSLWSSCIRHGSAGKLPLLRRFRWSPDPRGTGVSVCHCRQVSRHSRPYPDHSPQTLRWLLFTHIRGIVGLLGVGLDKTDHLTTSAGFGWPRYSISDQLNKMVSYSAEGLSKWTFFQKWWKLFRHFAFHHLTISPFPTSRRVPKLFSDKKPLSGDISMLSGDCIFWKISCAVLLRSQ